MKIKKYMKKIIILAGNFEQFKNYVDSQDRNHQDFVYCSSIEAILGIDAEKIITVGTFWNRQDAGKLKDFADSRIRE